MELRPGLKVKSMVSEAEFIVVRGTGEGDLQSGGEPVTEDIAAVPSGATVEGEVLLGKRYSDESGSVEIMCVKAGAGTLTLDGAALQVRPPRSLPSSD